MPFLFRRTDRFLVHPVREATGCSIPNFLRWNMGESTCFCIYVYTVYIYIYLYIIICWKMCWCNMIYIIGHTRQTIHGIHLEIPSPRWKLEPLWTVLTCRGSKIKCFKMNRRSLIWVNYNDLTATSLEIMVSKGNHSQMALIQVSELL